MKKIQATKSQKTSTPLPLRRNFKFKVIVSRNLSGIDVIDEMLGGFPTGENVSSLFVDDNLIYKLGNLKKSIIISGKDNDKLAHEVLVPTAAKSFIESLDFGYNIYLKDFPFIEIEDRKKSLIYLNKNVPQAILNLSIDEYKISISDIYLHINDIFDFDFPKNFL